MSKRHYDAKCHCGAVTFSFQSEPITEGRRCNCSICKRKGAVVTAFYIPAEDFQPIEDLSVVTDYRWQDNDVNHLFCKACGIYPYHGGPEWGYRVNLGCVDDIDVFALEMGIIDGKAM